MLQRLNELARQQRSFAFETTLASRFYANWIKGLQRNSYRFTLIFLWLESPGLAEERVNERVRLGGHDLPSETIVRRYGRGLRNLFDLYIPIANTWSVRNTSGVESVEIARYTDEEAEKIFNEEIWSQIKRQVAQT
jgi:predicted ABC-type ATPase